MNRYRPGHANERATAAGGAGGQPPGSLVPPAPSRVTRAVRAGLDADPTHRAVMPPIHLSSNFHFDAPGVFGRYDYTRSGNPTRDLAANAISELEGGCGAVVTSSGMSAASIVTRLLSAGDLLLAPHDCYGGCHRLFSAEAARGSYRVRFVDQTAPGALERARVLRPRLIWIETPSNPLLRITDIGAWARLARETGALSVVDNTFLSPVNQQPLDHGADLVVHSTTKFLNGHSDVVGGAVVAADPALLEEVAWWTNAAGVAGSPFDAYLTLRGMRTLHARARVHEENALAVVGALARHEGRGVRYCVVANDHPRGLDQSGLDGVVQAEVAHDPAEQRLLGTPFARWCERRGGEVVAGQNAARPVDPIQTTDPLGSGLYFFLRNSFDFRLSGNAPGMVRLVVDHQDVARIRHVAEHVAHVGLVAPGAALVDAAPSGDSLLGLPIERMPVADQNPALQQLVTQRRRYDAECLVVVFRMGRLQNGQTAPDREAGRDHEHVLGKPRVLRIGNLVQHLPRNDHRHDDGLAGAGRHLRAQARERSPVGCNLYPDPVGRRRLNEPDQRLRGLQLAEEKLPGGEFLRIIPVGEQPSSDPGHAWIPVLAPLPYARADPIDQRNLDEHTRIVECLGVRRRHDVARRSTPVGQIEHPGVTLVSPVSLRFLEGRVHDEPVYRGARHYCGSSDTSGSMSASRFGTLSCEVFHTTPISMSSYP